VPHTVAADGALRENYDCLFCLERLPHPSESDVVAAATLNPDCAESVEHPPKQSGLPEFHLSEETQFPRNRRPQDDPVEHRVMIRCDDERAGDGEAIGPDHLESIHGAYQAAEETANLRIGWSGEWYKTRIVVCPTVDRSIHQ